jgi:hypothetical protein
MALKPISLYLQATAWWQGVRIARMARNPMVEQRRLLARILTVNRKTRFGREHGFDGIDDYASYVRNVPVREFEELRAFVEAEIENGEAVLTVTPPLCYVRTSGTTGKPKDLPLTASHLHALQRIQRTAVAFQYRNYPEGFAGSILAITSPASEGTLPNGKHYGSASGIVSRSTARSIRGRFVLPYQMLAIADSRLKYLLILRLALERKDISYIGAANPSTLLALMKIYREYREQLVRDIRSGGFFLFAELPKDIAVAVAPNLRANPARSDELASLGSTERIADLWPELRLIVAWTCAGAGVAAAALKQEISPRTKILELGYVSSEFRGTITLGRSSGSGFPTVDTHFFEFVEREKWDAGQPEFLTIDSLRKRSLYYVLVTTPSGLYRYFINDLVEVTGFLHQTPLLRFVQKGKGVTSITGEKLYESQVLTAVSASLQTLGRHPHFLMMLADETNACYRLYVEVGDAKGLPTEEILASLVDARLSTLNLEYQAKRESLRLGSITANWLLPGTGEAYKRHCVAQGQRDGQFKVVAITYRKNFSFDFAPHIAGTAHETTTA